MANPKIRIRRDVNEPGDLIISDWDSDQVILQLWQPRDDKTVIDITLGQRGWTEVIQAGPTTFLLEPVGNV